MEVFGISGYACFVKVWFGWCKRSDASLRMPVMGMLGRCRWIVGTLAGFLCLYLCFFSRISVFLRES